MNCCSTSANNNSLGGLTSLTTPAILRWNYEHLKITAYFPAPNLCCESYYMFNKFKILENI